VLLQSELASEQDKRALATALVHLHEPSTGLVDPAWRRQSYIPSRRKSQTMTSCRLMKQQIPKAVVELCKSEQHSTGVSRW